MGYIAHHAIVVTGRIRNTSVEQSIESAHQKATSLGMAVTPIVSSPVNEYGSFMVAPDGSKEGWGESDVGDAQRKCFIDWLDTQRYEDNSTSLYWVEIRYSSDDRDATVTDHAWLKYPLTFR